MARKSGYSFPQIALHWIVALLILAAFLTHDDMGDALDQRLDDGATGTPIHVWLGLAALGFVAIRIVVRLIKGAPPQPATSSAKEAMAAHIGHGLLYLLMVAAPLLGIAAWYLGLDEAGDIHELVGKAVFLLGLAHGGVAILHAVLKKDGVLTRMLKPAA